MSYHFYRSILTIYTGHSLSETNIFATHGILIHPVPGNFTCPKISLQSTVGLHLHKVIEMSYLSKWVDTKWVDLLLADLANQNDSVTGPCISLDVL